MNITLVRPPFYNFMGRESSYPLNIGTLYSFLLEKGWNVCFVDGELIHLPGISGSEEFVSMIFGDTKRDFSHLNVLMNSDHFIWDQISDKILSTKPDIVGFSSYTSTITAVKVLSKR